MSFKIFITESKSETIESFFAVTDGKKYYNVNGHSYKIDLFKDNGILHDSKRDAEIVLEALPPEDGYENLRIVKITINADIEETLMDN